MKEEEIKVKVKLPGDQIEELIEEIVGELDLTKLIGPNHNAIRIKNAMEKLKRQVKKLATEYIKSTGMVQGLKAERSEILWLLRMETQILNILPMIGIDWEDFPGTKALVDRGKKIIEFYESQGEIPEEFPLGPGGCSGVCSDPFEETRVNYKCTDPSIFPITIEKPDLFKRGEEGEKKL